MRFQIFIQENLYPVVCGSTGELPNFPAPWVPAGHRHNRDVRFLNSLHRSVRLCRVEPAYVQEDPYAGFSRHIPHFVAASDSGDQNLLTVSPTKSLVLNPQQFTAAKPKDVCRIVCLGGSTTYGRPFYDLTSFHGWLRELLPVAQPNRRWEVINAGGISYASYRAPGVMQEPARYEPDLFIVYTGQNEFLERRTYQGLSDSDSLLNGPLSLAFRTRTATVVRNVLDLAGVRPTPKNHRAPFLGEETKAIPIDAVGPAAYERDEALQNEVVEHFEATLRRMEQVAQKANADILFVVPASNLADFAPFRSQHREAMFHDHVHPTVEANRLLALAIIDELQNRHTVQPEATWGDEAVRRMTEQIQGRIDRPLHARQLRLLATMLGWLKQPTAARTQAELSLELSGRTEPALLELADVLQANGATELAMEYFQAAVQVAPASAPAHFRLAACALDNGSEELGIQHLNKAIELDPRLADARVRLGVALATRGQLQAAKSHYEAAIQSAVRLRLPDEAAPRLAFQWTHTAPESRPGRLWSSSTT